MAFSGILQFAAVSNLRVFSNKSQGFLPSIVLKESATVTIAVKVGYSGAFRWLNNVHYLPYLYRTMCYHGTSVGCLK